MQRKWLVQFSVQFVLILIGLGGGFIPNQDTWIPSIIIWFVAGIWALITLVYWRRSVKAMIQGGNHEKGSDQAQKVIIDNKAESILAIPTTIRSLWTLEDGIVDKLSTKRYSLESINKLRREMGRRLNIKPVDSWREYSSMDITAKTKKTMKKLGLSKTSFSDEHIEFLLKIKFVLDRAGVGTYQKLKDNKDYISLRDKLRMQAAFVSGKTTEEAITSCLSAPSGINSIYLYYNYHPKEYKDILPRELNIETSEFLEKRETIERGLLQYLRKTIEDELKRK